MPELGYDNRASVELLATFDEYIKLNRRAVPELVQKQTLELANFLFLKTPRASAPEIHAKLESLGARFIRAPRGFARKVGRQKHPEPGEMKGYEAGVKEGKLTLSQEKFAAYTYRIGNIGTMAASWIPAMRELGSKMKVAQEDAARAARRPMSRVIAFKDDNLASISIVNEQPGMEGLNEETDFVDEAMLATKLNMQSYIDRKRNEARAVFHKHALAAR